MERRDPHGRQHRGPEGRDQRRHRSVGRRQLLRVDRSVRAGGRPDQGGYDRRLRGARQPVVPEHVLRRTMSPSSRREAMSPPAASPSRPTPLRRAARVGPSPSRPRATSPWTRRRYSPRAIRLAGGGFGTGGTVECPRVHRDPELGEPPGWRRGHRRRSADGHRSSRGPERSHLPHVLCRGSHQHRQHLVPGHPRDLHHPGLRDERVFFRGTGAAGSLCSCLSACAPRGTPTRSWSRPPPYRP